jgi:hypothetical protein
VPLDGDVIWILDADMDGVLGELKEDGLAGPRAGVVQPFAGHAWTHSGGYELSFEDAKNGKKLSKKPIAMPKGSENSDLNRGWALFNCWRQRAGAEMLDWDDKMEEQCRKHAEYCHKTGYMGHEEDPDNPHYTREGDLGGRSSNCGYAYATYYESTLEQMRTVYHCAQMLDPNLKKSAMALVGTCYAVDVRNGLTAWRTGKGVLFFWPPHGATDVYRDFNPAGEHPMPIEGRITDYQEKIGQCAFAAVNAKGPYEVEILDKDGKQVPSHITHPEKSASLYGGNDGIVCAAPKSPLKGAAWFTANIRCGLKGSEGYVEFSWAFKTR